MKGPFKMKGMSFKGESPVKKFDWGAVGEATAKGAVQGGISAVGQHIGTDLSGISGAITSGMFTGEKKKKKKRRAEEAGRKWAKKAKEPKTVKTPEEIAGIKKDEIKIKSRTPLYNKKSKSKPKNMTSVPPSELKKLQKPAKGFKWVKLDGKISQIKI